MREYMAKYNHRIAPRPDDIAGPFEISDNAFSNKNTLAKAMRKAGILTSGERLRSMRIETDREGTKTVVFPARPSPWHSIVLIEGAYESPGVDYPGYRRTRPGAASLSASTWKILEKK